MIIFPHLLIGAAIGAKIKNFGRIIFLAIISHFILDRIPHWDYGHRTIEKCALNKSYKKLVIFFFKMVIDGLIGLSIVLFIIWRKNMIDLNYLYFLGTGIFFSLLPDLMLGTSKLLFYFNIFTGFTKKYIDFHEKILHHPKHILKPTPVGVGTEILVSIIAILILIFS